MVLLPPPGNAAVSPFYSISAGLMTTSPPLLLTLNSDAALLTSPCSNSCLTAAATARRLLSFSSTSISASARPPSPPTSLSRNSSTRIYSACWAPCAQTSAGCIIAAARSGSFFHKVCILSPYFNIQTHSFSSHRIPTPPAPGTVRWETVLVSFFSGLDGAAACVRGRKKWILLPPDFTPPGALSLRRR